MFCDKIVMKLFVSYDLYLHLYIGIWVLFIEIVYMQSAIKDIIGL